MSSMQERVWLRVQVCYLRHAFGLGEHYNSLGVVDARQAEEGL